MHRKRKKSTRRNAAPLEPVANAARRSLRTVLRLHSISFLLLSFAGVFLLCALVGITITLREINVSHDLRLQGRVQAIDQAVPIKHDIGGVVKTIFVTEGEVVQEGQLLLSLGTDDLEGQHEDARKKVAQLLLQARCLRALRAEDAKLDVPITLRTAAARLEQAEYLKSLVRNCNVQLERRALTNSQYHMELAALEDRLSVEERRLVTRETLQLRILDSEKEDAFDAKLQEISKLQSLEKTLEQALAVNEAKERLENRRRELKRAEIDRLSSLDNQIDAITGDLLAAEQALAILEKQIKGRFVYANTSGRIQRMRIRQPGGRLAAGAYFLEIAPLTTDFEVLSTVGIADSPDIAVGQPVDVRLSAGMPRPVWVPAHIDEITRATANKRLVRIRLTREDLNRRDLLRGDRALNGLGEQSEAVISVTSENAWRSLSNILSRQWIGKGDEV